MLFPKVLRADILEHATHIGRQLRLDAFIGKVSGKLRWHKAYIESLEKVERWVKQAKTTCLFSYDAGQMLSAAERYRNTAQRIDQLCLSHIFKLTNKIRTNKELALFITGLRDLSKYRNDYSFPNVQIFYEPQKTMQ